MRITIPFAFLLFIFCGNQVVAQQNKVSDYPEVLHSDFINQTQAQKRLCEDQDFSASFVTQKYSNLLSDVSYSHFSAFVRIKKNHQLGILANNLKEGTYIDKTRGYLHYAYTIQVIKKTALSVGMSGGGIKIGEVEPGVGSKQITAPDLNANLLVYHPNYFLYYSVNQALSSRMQPNSNIYLSRYQEFRAGGKIQLAVEWYLKPQVHALFYTDKLNLYGGLVEINYHQLISLGIGTYNLNTFLVQSSLDLQWKEEYRLTFLGSYRQLFSESQLNAYLNSWEVGLCISKFSYKTVHDAIE